jgi:phosphoenolpyruvate carboxykinase (ATP)
MNLNPEGATVFEKNGIEGSRGRWNLPAAALYEEAVRRGEGLIAAEGPLVCQTVPYTGRSPNDKFIVREPSTERDIAWGQVNRPMSLEHFETLRRDLIASLMGAELFVQDCVAGADPRYRLPIRVVTELAWHSLFARNLFITRGAASDSERGRERFTVISAPSFKADPLRHGTRSEAVIAVNFAARLVLIAGTRYAGELKKSVFGIMNFLLPFEDVLPMHCSANIGSRGDTALFFGLSGTGKTSLSSDPERRLIGDDETGWSEQGVFNFEGGCYAKTIRLSVTSEPQIYAAARRFGTVLENVVVDDTTRALDFDDDRLTENTRAAYPTSFIENADPSARGGHPQNIVMLTADAFGVLPPISRLTPAAAMYHFLSGYTAKVAGTERGVSEPKATFSACFGAAFLPLRPGRYATMLGARVAARRVRVWLVNTGWTGGAYGVGARMKIDQTRAMIRGALSGALDDVEYRTDPFFNLDVPTTCPDVPSDLLTPKLTWRSEAEYDVQAARLARMFAENFSAFEGEVDAEVLAAGPRPSNRP